MNISANELLVKKIKHLAVIMDGNRRWAKSRNLPTIEGHRAGVQSLKNLVKLCHRLDIDYLTVYAFSTENWKREKTELDFLFKLLAQAAIGELSSLKSQNVRVKFLGDISAFKNVNIYQELKNLEEQTASNTGTKLQIALNYGSMAEILNAVQNIKDTLKPNEITALDNESFSNYLYTAGIPNPDIMIRTGGDKRLSNYLLWQLAEARLVFVDTLWPDFSEQDLAGVIDLNTVF
jgi:undecaprenyl diphosphate synthase